MLTKPILAPRLVLYPLLISRFCCQVLYSEQVRGFPGKQDYTLRCELFGLAGHYALFLRPTTPSPALPHTAAYVKVIRSDSDGQSEVRWDRVGLSCPVCA